MQNFLNYDISADIQPHFDVPAVMKQCGRLKETQFIPLSFPKSVEEEERGIQAQPITTASLSFERNRSQVREALQAILARIFRDFNLPTSNGADLGSGATGAMVEELLSPIISKKSWIQVETNPAAIAENRRRHPSSAVMQGSYLRLEETLHLRDKLDIVTGLSSFDATHFIEQAVEQARIALKKNGYFLHMQDVRPGLGVCFRELEAMGFRPPYKVDILQSNVGIQEPLVYTLPDGRKMSVGELFRRNLGRAIEGNSGMELVFNKWVTSRKALPAGTPGRAYFQNVLLSGFQVPLEEVSAVVTIARKK